ncbi:hypothetical protein [Phyllobacterium sp. YR531]|uniref:hypothetical protein n=1 Tax=Phyllobacterium sp. YR531 TaxID=1144343 RepID=UPI00026FB20E|nr:hypothetical protein [Phyllobacterium sp. YR531]EJN05454.1 hypothetical protein PMI41_01244 [Phyllobacterium sp. YR531]
MSSYYYLLWAITKQHITSGKKRRMPEDEYYEKYGRSPGRFSSLWKRLFVLVRSLVSGSKSS